MSARHTRLNKIPYKLVLVMALLLAHLNTANAQGSSELQGVRRSVATVIFCGLGGAVLGLSTLSFYGRPQDHTGNIYAGLGAGLIAGVGYVMMEPSDMAMALPPRPELSLFAEAPKSKGPPAAVPLAAYTWSF
ncbi:MAG: hypothetical protein KF767_04530 [Bdellovibrionaceae bacterium]|nr:hypothetical protein [Pseudobdellovibrionaceae bacterium]